MFILSNLLEAVAHVLNALFNLMIILITIRALISWVNPDPSNPIVIFLYKTTEPILEPIRRRMPLDFRFGIDISPIIVVLAIIFLRMFLVNTLFDLAARMR